MTVTNVNTYTPTPYQTDKCVNVKVFISCVDIKENVPNRTRKKQHHFQTVAILAQVAL